jgi:hypothetical protein
LEEMMASLKRKMVGGLACVAAFGASGATADSCPNLTADASRYEPTEPSAIMTFERPGALEINEEASVNTIGAGDEYRAVLKVRGGSGSIELSQESPETASDSVPDLADRDEIDTFGYGGREASLQELISGSTPYVAYVPHEEDDGISYVSIETTVTAGDDDACTEDVLNAAAEAVLRSVRPR